MKQPTSAQLRYLEVIEAFWIKHGIGPTQEELATRLDRHPSTVRYMLGRLEDNHFILPQTGQQRSIRTTRMKYSIAIGNWPGKS